MWGNVRQEQAEHAAASGRNDLRPPPPPPRHPQHFKPLSSAKQDEVSELPPWLVYRDEPSEVSLRLHEVGDSAVLALRESHERAEAC